MSEAQRSVYLLRRKDSTVALLLCLFLGGWGAHRFYLGSILGGVLCVLFCWTLIPLLLSLIDLFLVTGRTRKYNARLAEEILGPAYASAAA